MIERIDFMLQQFLQGVILNMLFRLILDILSKFNLSTRGLNLLTSPGIFKYKSV